MDMEQEENLRNCQAVTDSAEPIPSVPDDRHPWEVNGMIKRVKENLGVRKLDKARPVTHEGVEYTFDFLHKPSCRLVKILTSFDIEEISRYKALPFAECISLILDIPAIYGERIRLRDIPDHILGVILEKDIFFICEDRLLDLSDVEIFFESKGYYERENRMRPGTHSLIANEAFIALETAWTVGDAQDYDNDCGKSVLFVGED